MRLYALDIETDTDAPSVTPGIPGGLDPSSGSVISVAVFDAASGQDAYFDGDEIELLCSLEAHLCTLPAGVVVTWNGANFDLPYLVARMARLDVRTTLRLTPANDRPPKYTALPGHHPNGYWATWGPHRHLDVAYAYQGFCHAEGVAWGLKPAATALGVDMVEVDRTDMGALSAAQLRAYNVSDVVGTAELATRLGGTELGRWLDPAPLEG